jgi:formiminoglutamase
MYRKPDKKNWRGREDIIDGKDGLRWHQKIQIINLADEIYTSLLPKSKKGLALLGFCSDEGVRRNQGRLGATEGATVLRSHLSNLPWHFEDDLTLLDAGDIFCLGEFLEDAQEDLGEAVEKLLEVNYQTILMGGGHEIAYGHYLGIKNFVRKKNARLGIINFDAHFDMRETLDGKASSGTPFLQIAKDLKQNQQDFNYFVLGIQRVSNTPKLFKTAEHWGVQFIPSERMDFMFIQDIHEQLAKFIERVDYVYVTVCLDVFSAAYAPGVSALNGSGIYPTIVTDLIKFISQTGKVLAFDVAELNPKFDLDGRTARLASNLIFSYVDACTMV